MHFNAKLLTAATTATDQYTAFWRTQYSRHNRFQLKAADFSQTPNGVFKAQVCEDIGSAEADVANSVYGTPASETAKWTEVEIPSEAVHGLGSGQTWSGGTVTWDGTAALNIWIDLADTGWLTRLWWDVTSGGGTTSHLTVIGAGFEE